MAEPYQKNGRWYVRFKDGRGRWRDKATDARTKTEARRLDLELSRKHERQRLGLDPLPSDAPEQTFGAAMDLWWSEHGKRLRSPTIHRFMEKHLRPELGPLPLSQVGDKLESLLNARVETLGPESLNHLRAAAHRVFAFLTRRGAWKGANPAVAVPRFKVPKRLPRYLRPDEVLLVLAALDARWRGLFATAVYLGLRRGEVIALRKDDVDLRARTIRIGRSGDSDTTKGGHEDLLPLPDELVPWIEAAMKRTPSELLYPQEDGRQHAPDVRLQDVLRRAMKRAGLVVGYDHRCRRKGCGFSERKPDAEAGRCPRCQMRLWPVAEPKPMRFHDLRHSTATLLLKAGVPLATVQKILRHTDPKITSEVYGHLDLEDMRAGLNRLALGLPPPPEQPPFAATLLLGPASPKTEGPDATRFPEGRQGLRTVGATGFEPATTCTPTTNPTGAPDDTGRTDSQGLGITEAPAPAPPPRGAPAAPPPTENGAHMGRGVPIPGVSGPRRPLDDLVLEAVLRGDLALALRLLEEAIKGR